MVCRDRHTTSDSRLGQPLCLDCYDHAAHVVWHHDAPELWRRTIQQVDREIRRLGRRLEMPLRRRYLKVYEFQVRGVIHYHALIRLDGYNPDCPEAAVPPPRQVRRDDLEDAVRRAFTIRRLFAKLITNTIRPGDFHLAWSRWRRTHQARAKAGHYRRRGDVDHHLLISARRQ